MHELHSHDLTFVFEHRPHVINSHQSCDVTPRFFFSINYSLRNEMCLTNTRLLTYNNPGVESSSSEFIIGENTDNDSYRFDVIMLTSEDGISWKILSDIIGHP